jgi:hypothetical protein
MVDLPEEAKQTWLLREALQRNTWLLGQLHDPKTAVPLDYQASLKKVVQGGKILNISQAEALLERFRSNFPKLAAF